MTGIDITAPPATPDFVQFREGFGQRFIVTVDTEEEFDWGAPLDRHRNGLTAVPAMRRFQQFCEGFGVAPIYLMDYPVADSPLAADALGEAIRSGKAEAGIHLHPWVNPPYEEEVNNYNSFAGNLSPALEREKFRLLTERIAAAIGAAPTIYRAGRYGLGPDSAAMLDDFGIAIDTSVRPLFDYSDMGAPDYSSHPLRPYWIDRERRLMELPLTTAYWGMLRQLGSWLYPALKRAPTLRGALAKLGMLERIPLTPEGVTAEEAIRGMDIALDAGLPLLVFSFHSPSLAPGHTPYVRNERDLEAFYDWWRQVFAYLARRNIAPTSAKEILQAVTLA